MARPSKANTPDDKPEQKVERFVLEKSAGFITDGRQCHHFPAGTEFDPERDGEIIAFLIRAGATFE